MRDIQPLVAPRSIAVLGASTTATKPGGVLFSNLLDGGFPGPLYPINPRATEVRGVKAYPDLRRIPQPVDLVYIVLPNQQVEAAIQQCIEAKARAACIISGGFSEAGPAGKTLEDKIREVAKSAGLLLAGPNTIGMLNAECRMMGSFVTFPQWEKGNISIFAQTGIFAGALMRQVMDSDVQRLPISKSIDVGNKIDVDEVDFLDFVADDPETKVIGIHVESILNPTTFAQKARALRGHKPIVLLMPGSTDPGKIASRYHTGSPPSDNAAIEAALEGTGILRVDDEDDFVNALRALAMLPTAKGRRVGIATTSGALGVIATDLVTNNGLELASYSPETLQKMSTILPDWLTPANPYDFWIGIDVKGPREAHEIALSAVFEDPNVDLIFCILLAPPNADFPEVGDLLRRLRRRHNKPAVLVVYGSAGARWTREVEGADLPVYSTVRAGARALKIVADAGA